MKFFSYIKESIGEIKHIKWPTRAQTTAFTIAVIIIALFVAYYLGLFDVIFTKLLQQVI